MSTQLPEVPSSLILSNQQDIIFSSFHPEDTSQQNHIEAYDRVASLFRWIVALDTSHAPVEVDNKPYWISYPSLELFMKGHKCTLATIDTQDSAIAAMVKNVVDNEYVDGQIKQLSSEQLGVILSHFRNYQQNRESIRDEEVTEANQSETPIAQTGNEEAQQVDQEGITHESRGAPSIYPQLLDVLDEAQIEPRAISVEPEALQEEEVTEANQSETPIAQLDEEGQQLDQADTTNASSNTSTVYTQLPEVLDEAQIDTTAISVEPEARHEQEVTENKKPQVPAETPVMKQPSLQKSPAPKKGPVLVTFPKLPTKEELKKIKVPKMDKEKQRAFAIKQLYGSKTALGIFASMINKKPDAIPGRFSKLLRTDKKLKSSHEVAYGAIKHVKPEVLAELAILAVSDPRANSQFKARVKQFVDILRDNGNGTRETFVSKLGRMIDKPGAILVLKYANKQTARNIFGT